MPLSSISTEDPIAIPTKGRTPYTAAGPSKDCTGPFQSGGTLAVWGENYDEGFFRRSNQGGFTVTCERPGKGGYRHAVFLSTKNQKPDSVEREIGVKSRVIIPRRQN